VEAHTFIRMLKKLPLQFGNFVNPKPTPETNLTYKEYAIQQVVCILQWWTIYIYQKVLEKAHNRKSSKF
jgi:hypothetical protein